MTFNNESDEAKFLLTHTKYKNYWHNGKLENCFYKNQYNRMDGLLKSYYKSGQLRNEINYKDDKRDGPDKEYYESGQLKSEINYKDGKQDGLARYYYENGKLEAQVNLKDGKQDGPILKYDENGKLIEDLSDSI